MTLFMIRLDLGFIAYSPLDSKQYCLTHNCDDSVPFGACRSDLLQVVLPPSYLIDGERRKQLSHT